MKSKWLSKVGAVALTGAMVMSSFTGCGKNDSTTDTTKATEKETEKKDDGGELDELTNEDLEAMSSKELAYYMGNGFNLGNTMEATDTGKYYGDMIDEGQTPEEIQQFFEQVWGQPITTQEMIDQIHDGGIDTIRIPVAWVCNSMRYQEGDYTISDAELARVKEIVDYCYNDNMFVIINDHWDGGWWGMFGAKDDNTKEEAWKLYESMWTQIADYFKDYDYHLIFEGGNEEIGDRLNDIDNPVVGGEGATLEKDTCYERALEINQKFVDVVRGTGGNNEKRFLLIPGYGTDITQTLDDRWSMPTDTAEGKLFLSVHYYTPWSYCGTTGEARWGTVKNVEEMNTIMSNLTKYEDYGIIIGECGVLPTSAGALKPDWQQWYTNFIGNCDVYGYVPVNWNTGDFIHKADGSWIDDEFKQFFIDHSFNSLKDKSIDDQKKDAQAAMDDVLANAPESFDTGEELTGDGEAKAWIMWDSQDWQLVHSVGDTYNADNDTLGITYEEPTITGEGEYTVSIDFTGTEGGYSTSTAFSAIGISNGETLFPGYIIDIKSFKINGEEYELTADPYTCSDDGLCTRVNIYNEWVGDDKVPGLFEEEGARAAVEDISNCKPIIVDQAADALQKIETLEITFDYKAGALGVSDYDGVDPKDYGTIGGGGSSENIAWLMWDSQDWQIVHAVGDEYNADNDTLGLKLTEPDVTGEGTYTVGIDFTGTDAGYSQSTAFAAIGIKDAETKYPGYIIEIQSIKINGEEYEMTGEPYTCSDDENCTRVNIYNEWVTKAITEIENARNSSGDLTNCTAVPIDRADELWQKIETIEITFNYTPGAQGISPNDANSKN